MKNESVRTRARIITSMLIYGTIGIFVKYTGLPSGVIAACRGLIGALFLAGVAFIGKNGFDFEKVRKSFLILTISGIMMGFNWVLLFEAYNYTTVATATLCYYFAPIFIIIASPFTLKEKLSTKKVICVAAALLGMVFVSGVFPQGISDISELNGIFFGIAAALLYAMIITVNKKLPDDLSANNRTVVQLAAAGTVMLIYSLFKGDFAKAEFGILPVVLLLIICIVHTGIAYQMYFGSVKKLSAQSVAIYSYIDPVTAIILSALILNEKMTVWTAAGAIIILGATFISETEFELHKKSKGE